MNLTLNEEGPWEEREVASHLQNLAKRIADCVAAIINGMIAQRFPESTGRPFVIRIQSFETPKSQVDALLMKLEEDIWHNAEIQAKLGTGYYALSIAFAHDWVDWATVIAHSQATTKRRSNFLDRLRALFRKGDRTM